MPGSKTHEQQVRDFEHKPDVPKPDEENAHPEQDISRASRNPDARQSEHQVSRQGMNQESRQHNTHNKPPAGAKKHH